MIMKSYCKILKSETITNQINTNIIENTTFNRYIVYKAKILK